ncbi:hypothetical protein TNCV_543071 [Trichonephila clavipes]|nr:hypothetical protein TNCV_543071 [Trichonephila clavipes]
MHLVHVELRVDVKGKKIPCESPEHSNLSSPNQARYPPPLASDSLSCLQALGAVDTRRYPRAENRVRSDQEDQEDRRIMRQALVDPTVTRSTIRADVTIVPQTIFRHLAEANLKSKRPFRALPLTSATASTVVPSQINVECHRLVKGCV